MVMWQSGCSATGLHLRICSIPWLHNYNLPWFMMFLLEISIYLEFLAKKCPTATKGLLNNCDIYLTIMVFALWLPQKRPWNRAHHVMTRLMTITTDNWNWKLGHHYKSRTICSSASLKQRSAAPTCKWETLCKTEEQGREVLQYTGQAVVKQEKHTSHSLEKAEDTPLGNAKFDWSMRF